MKMTLENLQELSIVDLKEFIGETRVELFDLFMKLDLDILRLGIMSLSVNSLHCNSYSIIENDDLLHYLSDLKGDYYASSVELSGRKQNA